MFASLYFLLGNFQSLETTKYLFFAGIQSEIGDPLETTNMTPNVLEVVDLLKGLPDAVPSIPCRKSGEKYKQTNISGVYPESWIQHSDKALASSCCSTKEMTSLTGACVTERNVQTTKSTNRSSVKTISV